MWRSCGELQLIHYEQEVEGVGVVNNIQIIRFLSNFFALTQVTSVWQQQVIITLFSALLSTQHEQNPIISSFP